MCRKSRSRKPRRRRRPSSNRVDAGSRAGLTRSRAPDAAQRVALREAVRCRAGAVPNAGAWYGPGSGERHEECRTASGTRLCMRLRRPSGERRAEIDAAQDHAGRIALEFDIEKLSRGAFLDAVAQPQELLLALLRR